jgi:UDP-N-acetylmuramoylalanine--D-glutamate ligase
MYYVQLKKMELVSQLEFHEFSMEKKNQKSIVLGGGISGKSAFSLLQKLGKNPVLVDAKDESAIKDTIGQAEIHLVQDEISGLVKSPGISPSHPWLLLAKERGIPIQSEIDLAKSQYKGLAIGITGTDGKSTTTSLTHHLISADFINSRLGGNIGKAFSDFALEDCSPIVLELSSYQLEDSENLHLDCSAILNLAPDHLERHGSIENYAKAKLKIIDLENPNHVFVTNHKTFQKLGLDSTHLLCKCKFFGEELGVDARIDEKNNRITTHHFSYSTEKFPLEGRHNLENLAVSILLAESIQASPISIQKQISTFHGLLHRFEKFHRSFSWTFVNDSKSTNSHSLLAWLKNFNPDNGHLILIMGGRPKGESMLPVVKLLVDIPSTIYIYGEASELWRQELSILSEKIHFKNTIADTIASIQKIWNSKRNNPSWVVLSPACASFDQFKNFEERGNFFKNLILNEFGNVE